MKHVAAIAVLTVLATVAGEAAEIDAASRIASVTVFPRGAAVTRVVDFTAPAGDSTLLLNDFPPTLDVESLRVSGAGDAGFKIGAIDSEIVHPSPIDPSRVSGIAAQIRTLRDERAALDDVISAAESEKRFIENFIKIKPQPLSEDLESGRAGPETWAKAWETVGRGLVRVNETMRDARIRQRAIDEAIEDLERKLRRDPSRDKPQLALRVDIAARAPVRGSLKIEYRVAEAGWVPFYDARLDLTAEGGSKLELVRRARIAQRSGEDWDDVKLKLSTARALGGTSAPELEPLAVRFHRPPAKQRVGYLKRTLRPQNEGVPAPVAEAEKAGDAGAVPPAPEPAREIEAEFETAGFNVVYDIPGRVSIGTGGATRSIRISSHETEPKLSVRAVPVLDAAAYLLAEIVNDTGAPLLPGKVALFRNGVFVGRGEIDLVADGDVARLGFGVDDLVTVTRLPVKRDRGETGFISRQNTDERDLTISVTNLHERAMTITIVERLPYAETEDIRIEVLDDTTPASETDIEGRRGVFTWTAEYGAGERKRFRLHYRVSWPKEREIVWGD